MTFLLDQQFPTLQREGPSVLRELLSRPPRYWQKRKYSKEKQKIQEMEQMEP